MEIKVGEVYIMYMTKTKDYTLDKIISIEGKYYTSNYSFIVKYTDYCMENRLNNEVYYNTFTGSLDSYDVIPLYEYLENPEKYTHINQIAISKMWKKFMENDIVEARKYKLKILNEYGN